VQAASCPVCLDSASSAPVWNLGAGCADGDKLPESIALRWRTRFQAGSALPGRCQQFGPKLAVTTLAPTQITSKRDGRSEITRTAAVPASTPLIAGRSGGPVGVETWRAKTSQLELGADQTANGSAMPPPIIALITTREFPRPATLPLVDGDTVRSSIAAAMRSGADGDRASAKPLSGNFGQMC